MNKTEWDELHYLFCNLDTNRFNTLWQKAWKSNSKLANELLGLWIK